MPSVLADGFPVNLGSFGKAEAEKAGKGTDDATLDKPASLPPLPIEITNAAGEVIHTFTVDDPRIGFCRAFNEQMARYGETARPGR